MKTTRRLLAFTFLAAAGLSSTTRAEDYGDFRVLPHKRPVYSKYYDAAAWLVPRHLGMSVEVENEKKHNPIFCEIQRSQSDSFAKGKVRIYLWNFDSQVHPVRILDVSSEVYPTAITGNVIYADPHARTGDVIGEINIFDASRVIPVRVRYEWHGRKWVVELLLARRTKEQEARFFGPDFDAPYPWP